MKKLLVAAAVSAAMIGSVSAADLGARPYKAPPPYAPVYSWTGFYISGGGGGGLWNADSNIQSTGVVGGLGTAFGPAGTALTRDQRLGGSGWFGTVAIGYDWQFSKWVAGVFADGQWGNIRGSLVDPAFGNEGREKLETSYAVGARIGYLVAPNVLSYVNGGYSGSQWSGTSLTTLAAGGGPVVATTPSFNRNGWFVGGGVENSFDFFGITAPGWFLKTEYRSAFYDRISLPVTLGPGAAPLVGPTGAAITFKPWNQTISTSLVYRFNWGGAPVGANY
jgi:outer membrane immunogenic protein